VANEYVSIQHQKNGEPTPKGEREEGNFNLYKASENEGGEERVVVESLIAPAPKKKVVLTIRWGKGRK